MPCHVVETNTQNPPEFNPPPCCFVLSVVVAPHTQADFRTKFPLIKKETTRTKTKLKSSYYDFTTNIYQTGVSRVYILRVILILIEIFRTF